MAVTRTLLDEPDSVMFAPAGNAGWGVLVLAGSSGRVEAERALRFAQAGALALSIRWFGGEGQPPGICEVPLETFSRALDTLAESAGSLAIVGSSKGAEAALLVAAEEPRVDAVVCFAPTDVVWANVGPGYDGSTHPYRSSWTRKGEPLDFVPYDDDWTPTGDPPESAGLYAQSRSTYPDAVAAAMIPVENIAAEMILVAGGDDRVWDSRSSADAIAERRSRASRTTRVFTHPAAGHRTILPGERLVSGGMRMSRGGTPVADAELGAQAWVAIQRLLDPEAGSAHAHVGRERG